MMVSSSGSGSDNKSPLKESALRKALGGHTQQQGQQSKVSLSSRSFKAKCADSFSDIDSVDSGYNAHTSVGGHGGHGGTLRGSTTGIAPINSARSDTNSSSSSTVVSGGGVGATNAAAFSGIGSGIIGANLNVPSVSSGPVSTGK